MNRALALAILCFLLPSCAATGPKAVVELEPALPEAEWRSIARTPDAARIDTLPAIWQAAKARVTRRARAAMNREGDVIGLDEGLSPAQPTPGSYRCRLLKVGEEAGKSGFRAYPSFFCYISAEEGGKFSFTKQTGSDLPGGWLYPDGDKRMVFLGTRRKSLDAPSPGYGHDEQLDLAGIVERIGPFRWRLVIPTSPAGLSVYEIVPVPVDQQPPSS